MYKSYWEYDSISQLKIPNGWKAHTHCWVLVMPSAWTMSCLGVCTFGSIILLWLAHLPINVAVHPDGLSVHILLPQDKSQVLRIAAQLLPSTVTTLYYVVLCLSRLQWIFQGTTSLQAYKFWLPQMTAYIQLNGFVSLLQNVIGCFFYRLVLAYVTISLRAL